MVYITIIICSYGTVPALAFWKSLGRNRSTSRRRRKKTNFRPLKTPIRRPFYKSILLYMKHTHTHVHINKIYTYNVIYIYMYIVYNRYNRYNMYISITAEGICFSVSPCSLRLQCRHANSKDVNAQLHKSRSEPFCCQDLPWKNTVKTMWKWTCLFLWTSCDFLGSYCFACSSEMLSKHVAQFW